MPCAVLAPLFLPGTPPEERGAGMSTPGTLSPVRHPSPQGRVPPLSSPTLPPLLIDPWIMVLTRSDWERFYAYFTKRKRKCLYK